MRVIHVVTAFPRHAGDPITPWLVELLRRQREAGLDARVLAPAYRGGPATPEAGADEASAGVDAVSGGAGATIADVPVERFRYAPAGLETLTHDETVPDRLRRRPLQALLVPPYLLGGMAAGRRLGRSDRPDVVHVHWPMPHAVIGAAIRRGSGGRSAVVCSYYSVEIRWVEARLRPLLPFLRWTARTADGLTAISSPTAEAVRSLVDRPVSVIPYGAALADDGSPPSRPALSAPESRPVRVLFVGRLVERKGVEVLVRAVTSGRFGRDVELRIVGTGEWEDRIRAAIPGAGESSDLLGSVGTNPRRVRLLGSLSDDALRAEYEAADVFVLPAVRDAKGDTEGLGVVLLEALRFERPVVASDIGGIPDIVRHEETGLLCPPGDPEALAVAIDRLIREPEAARAMGRRGRERAATEFGWPRIVEATTAAYEQAVRSRTAG